MNSIKDEVSVGYTLELLEDMISQLTDVQAIIASHFNNKSNKIQFREYESIYEKLIDIKQILYKDYGKLVLSIKLDNSGYN